MGEVLEFPARRIPEVARRDVPSGRAEPEELWRELVGHQLRQERRARGERLADVAERAGVSTQYLSEVERGLKDPSSEMLQAMTGALELTVRQLVSRFASSGVMCLAA